VNGLLYFPKNIHPHTNNSEIWLWLYFGSYYLWPPPVMVFILRPILLTRTFLSSLFFDQARTEIFLFFFNNKTDLKGVKPLRGMLWSFELLCINPDLFLGPWYYHLGSSNWVFHSPLPGLYKIYIYIYILSQPKWYFPPSLATSLYFSARQIQLWWSLIKPFRWWSFVINKAWTRDFHVINKVL